MYTSPNETAPCVSSHRIFTIHLLPNVAGVKTTETVEPLATVSVSVPVSSVIGHVPCIASVVHVYLTLEDSGSVNLAVTVVEVPI